MDTTSQKIQGTVKWFNAEKGYGFINAEPGALESLGRHKDYPVFVHFSAIEGEGFKSLAEGQPVEFLVKDDYRGPIASHVTRVFKNNSAKANFLIETTDTFGGEANYSWVKRVEVNSLPGFSNRRALLKEVRKLLRIEGSKLKFIHYSPDMLVYDIRGACIRIFIIAQY